MSYEYFIRRVYQVDRFERREADADVYRELEHAERLYTLDIENIKQNQMRVSTKSIDDLEYEYNVQCRKIWRIVVNAIQDGISKYRFSPDEIIVMNKAMITPQHISKEHIDQTIKLVEDIYVKHEIFPK